MKSDSVVDSLRPGDLGGEFTTDPFSEDPEDDASAGDEGESETGTDFITDPPCSMEPNFLVDSLRPGDLGGEFTTDPVSKYPEVDVSTIDKGVEESDRDVVTNPPCSMALVSAVDSLSPGDLGGDFTTNLFSKDPEDNVFT
jgi:hypothetical protein